jgi:hypothetical protein
MWLSWQKIITNDFFYDLFDGGYIKPEDLLKDENDVETIKNAIKIIKEFRDLAEENDVLDHI